MELHVFWFLLLGALLTGYAVLDGFDLGVGALHLWVARSDHDRRVVLNAIGPVWDGNEVWLVTFGGALFAAFPGAYAAAFSGFYLPMVFLLTGLIFRAVAIEFRSKSPSPVWRRGWDIAFCLASASSALVLGTALGAIFHGLPIGPTGDLVGSEAERFPPFSLLVGSLTVALFALHGASYLVTKTDGELQLRARRLVVPLTVVVGMLYAATTFRALALMPAFESDLSERPWITAVGMLNVLALLNVPRASRGGSHLQAFFSSGAVIAGLVGLFGAAQYPDLIRSTRGPSTSLTIYNCASSVMTLGIMRLVALLGLPFVAGYTGIVYWVFRGKVHRDKLTY